MNFDLINEQADIKKILLNTKRKNRLSHAYIFEGPAGVGKREMAYFFAMMLYCKEDEPCMRCEVCHQILNNEHLNVYVISSDSKVIKKEQIVGLQEEFSKTSNVSGPRIYIIVDADKMNQNSQNSLLKFIEEPEEGIYGILCTTNVGKILPTITSRCQTISFKSLDDRLLASMLENKGVEAHLAAILSKLTNNIDDAILMSSDPNALRLNDLFKDFLDVDSPSKAVMYQRKNLGFFDNYDNLLSFLNLLIILYSDIISLYNGVLDIHLKGYINEIAKYKNYLSYDAAKKNLELVYSLVLKLQNNVMPKNILNNLFVNIF